MLAIQSKFLPITNSRGARIKISCREFPTKIWTLDSVEKWARETLNVGLGDNERAMELARKRYLQEFKLDWEENNHFVIGTLPDGSYAHVMESNAVLNAKLYQNPFWTKV